MKGVTRQMDCMDCHTQATHIFQTPQDAMNQAIQNGTPNPALPFIHKKASNCCRRVTLRKMKPPRKFVQVCRTSIARNIQQSGAGSATMLTLPPRSWL